MNDEERFRGFSKSAFNHPLSLFTQASGWPRFLVVLPGWLSL
ncbi:hypothetical protein [Vreelandella nanhaiensis]|nr:hypothetical protein [Halomonas nanhaiensis]